MLISEERIKSEDFAQRFKLAMVTADPGTWIPKMFPAWGTGVAQEPTNVIIDESSDLDELDLHDTSGDWVFDTEVSAEEAERVMAEMLAERGGTISWDDLDEDETGEWV